MVAPVAVDPGWLANVAWGTERLNMVRWLAAFAFTQLVECPIYFVALRRRTSGRGVGLAIAFGASALTHPVVWFVIPPLWYEMLGQTSYLGMALLAEAFAVVAEGWYLSRFAVRRPWLWALGANLASVTLGLASRALWGWP